MSAPNPASSPSARTRSIKPAMVAIYVALALVAFACGSDDSTEVSVAGDETTVQPADDPATDAGESTDDAPIPVEPDGGIGDGAEPLPGAEEPEDTGTWHGAQVAETNCPGMTWMRVQANAFSFSVPADFVASDIQPIDSEVGLWTGGNGIEVLYDYGWYSGSFENTPGSETEPIDYSGIAGAQTIVREGDRKFVGVFFDEVAVVEGQADRLSLQVTFADTNDEIIGRCIAGSIEWNA